jgi:asparagine synthase (glutamine-hydrolysing)
MCGLAGYWNLEFEALPSLCPSLQNRGPDGRGEFSDQFVKLFHTRLAIMDLTENGAQPMTNSEGKAIVFNGEIYNFRELKSHLINLGYKFKSTSDTEVILNLYNHYGNNCFALLRGMFAIAIYDNSDIITGPKLVLARDHFGMKPLLYSNRFSGLVFASDLKTLVSSGIVSKKLDPQALRELFAVGSIYQPKTILQDVTSVPAGSYMSITLQGSQIFRYWNPTASDPNPEIQSETRLVEKADEIINESIALHLLAEVPVSTLLSGGLDSSLIAAMVAKNHNSKIDTFTVGFDSTSDLDESSNANELSLFLRTSHTKIHLSDNHIESDFLDFVAAIDQPSMDGFNSYLVSRAVAMKTKVTLSGTGGDELFGGYPWFKSSVERRRNLYLPKISRKTREFLFSSGHESRVLNKIAFASDLGSFAKQNQALGFVESSKTLIESTSDGGGFDNSFLDFESRDLMSDESAISRMTYFCCSGYLQNQLLRDIDATSMDNSLEIRMPLLDLEVFKFATSLPDAMKVRLPSISISNGSYSQTGQKFILGKLSHKYLPDGFLDRKKQGFDLPIDSWLRGPMKNLLETKLSNFNLSKIEHLDVERVLFLKEQFLHGKLAPVKIWLILTFVIWYENLMNDDFRR